MSETREVAVDGEMKMWLLRAKRGDDLPDGVEDPWEPWYDKTFGHVVAAPDERTARRIANQHGWDETGEVSQTVYRRGGDPWLDPELTTCEVLDGASYDEPTHIIRDGASA